MGHWIIFCDLGKIANTQKFWNMGQKKKKKKKKKKT